MKRVGDRFAIFLGLAVLLSCTAGCGDSKKETTIAFEKVDTPSLQATMPSLQLPFVLPDSGLIVEEFIRYDGPYWEDGSGEQVKDAAALMLYNPTERMVEFAAVSVEQGAQQRYYFVYRLPPQSRCLVLEQAPTPYGEGGVTACRELCVRWEYQELSRERLNYLGFGEKLTVINREARGQEHIILWYKQYVKEKDYYLGGVAHAVHLHFLQPKEQRVLRPEHYDAASARVVTIRIEE